MDIKKQYFMPNLILFLVSIITLITCFDTSASINYVGKDGKKAIYEIEPELNYKDLDHKKHFNNLDYGLRLEVVSEVSKDGIVQMYDRKPKDMEKAPIFLSTIEPAELVQETLNKYLRDMGIIMYADPSTDRVLRVIITQFDVSEITANARTVLHYELCDTDGNIIIPRQTASGSDKSKMVKYDKVLGKSCAKAISAIDWNSIVFHLKARQTAHSEHEVKVTAQPSVTGHGDTSLEQTIIRWLIISSPQGADITWRVISSTPDVKNTNGNYIGTTPYESTESFDIKGLTYQNAGNVQIEVECEKSGYLSQKKRFNVRQAIDQKEISAKFNLVKDE